MNNDLHTQNPQDWAALHFANTKLNDPRRQRRAQTIAAAFARNPGKSIPKLFTRVHDIKATYTFFNVNDTTPSNLQATHTNLVHNTITQPGTYLLIEDGSEFNWNDKTPRTGLGPMHHKHQGFVLHTSLAVQWQTPNTGQHKRAPTRIIGLAHQEYYARIPKPADEGNQDSQARKKRPRESQLWQRSGISIGEAPKQTDVRWIRVADRGADIEFFLRDCQTLGHGFVVRAAQNRSLVNDHNERLSDKLFETSRAQVSLGEFDLELRSRPNQAARTARLSVSATRVALRGPHSQEAAVVCSVIRIWEMSPDLGVEALEWILLSDTQPTSFEMAVEIGLQYASRWLVEEYHKCLKTGLGADSLQLETANRLFAAISVMAVVAVRLLALKESTRFEPEAEVSASGLSDLELQVLSLVLERKLRCVRDVALGLGRLGGHMNRKADGLPGWQSLWAGMQRLQSLVDGVVLAKQIRTCGE